MRWGLTIGGKSEGASTAGGVAGVHNETTSWAERGGTTDRAKGAVYAETRQKGGVIDGDRMQKGTSPSIGRRWGAIRGRRSA